MPECYIVSKGKKTTSLKIERRKVGHVWRMKYLLTSAFEGKIEGAKGRGRRLKQLLDYLK